MLADVVLTQHLVKALTYIIPAEFEGQLKIGCQVTVPLQNRTAIGYILKLYADQKSSRIDLKPILALQQEKAFFDETTVALLEWLCHYYVVPLSRILPSVLPVGMKRIKSIDPGRLTEMEPELPLNDQSVSLSEEQEAIYQQIINHSDRHHLIHGITGSGKSYIYFKIIENLIKKGKSVMVLVPEISLTYAFQKSLQNQFGPLVVMLHSALTQKERREAWLQLKNMPVSIVIGTRSAVFAPQQNLAAIIIDEEQDSAYKQEKTPKYNAKVVAYRKVQLEKAQLILGTATPLISTYYQATQHAYMYHALTHRFHQVRAVTTEIVDLKQNDLFPKNLLSHALVKRIQETLIRKEQVLLLYNQRGLARVLRCEDCGQTVYCPRCSVTLTVHNDGLAKCHYCGFQQTIPTVCPDCGGFKLKPSGKGIQSLTAEIKKRFPAARFRRLDSDISREKGYLADTLHDFKAESIDILVGTQMVAKGHHFPSVTLVGVIDADIGLFFPDLYATERTFQLLVQVMGRAGRENKPGHVIIQTYMGDHPVIQSALNQDYKTFYEAELALRKETNSPPFFRMIKIQAEHENDTLVETELSTLYNRLTKLFPHIEFLEPIPALIHKVKRRFRWVFFIKFPLGTQSSELKKELFKLTYQQSHKVAITIDVDPVSTLF